MQHFCWLFISNFTIFSSIDMIIAKKNFLKILGAISSELDKFGNNFNFKSIKKFVGDYLIFIGIDGQ